MTMMMTGLRSGQFGFDIDDDVMSLHASTEKPCSLGLLGQTYCQLINTGTRTHTHTQSRRQKSEEKRQRVCKTDKVLCV